MFICARGLSGVSSPARRPLGQQRRNDLRLLASTAAPTHAQDQVGVGLEDGIDLLGVCHLLSVEYAAARLIDYAGSKTTIVCDLLAEARDGQVGKQVIAARLAGALKDPLCAGLGSM